MTPRPNEPVLFVSHQASRTGAPHVLLHLLRWIREHTDLSFHVLLLRRGPLESAFREVAPLTVLTDVPLGSKLTVMERELAKGRLDAVSAGIRRVFRLYLRHLRDFEVVYLNSICSVPSLRYLPRPPRTVITHVHELEIGMRSALSHSLLAPLPEPDRRDPLRSTDLFIAAADCVKDHLLARGVPAGKVRRHYEFIDVERALTAPDRSSIVRRQLSLSPSTRLVVGSGTVEWRKGPDLFVQLARTILQHRPRADVRFLWIGGDDEGTARWFLDHDVLRGGLEGRVRFLGSQSNPLDYFRLADVFVLTSREDPFPLVCLEASLFEKPVVSFDNGGMREFLAGGRGSIVPYLDIDAMAVQVEALLDDPNRGRAAAGRAAARVREHHDVSAVAPLLFEDVQKAIGTAAAVSHTAATTLT